MRKIVSAGVLFLLAGVAAWFAYSAVSSVWGYPNDGARWQYAPGAVGLLLLAALFVFIGFRIIRDRSG